MAKDVHRSSHPYCTVEALTTTLCLALRFITVEYKLNVKYKQACGCWMAGFAVPSEGVF